MSPFSSPKLIDGDDVEVSFRRVRLRPQVEHDPGKERVASEVAQLSKWRDLSGIDPLRGLDLDCNDSPIVSFDDEVDLVAVSGPPVAEARNVVEPGGLFHQLSDDERLEEMAQLGKSARITVAGRPMQ